MNKHLIQVSASALMRQTKDVSEILHALELCTSTYRYRVLYEALKRLERTGVEIFEEANK